MGYTPSFTPQYENGWENLPIEETPITAEALNAYDDAIENIEDYLASDESQANLADAYNETATYEAGDYVIYGGDLYKCLEDIDTPEEWDSTKWERCLITDEMATSGGTTVIANPSGQATETLTKLQVEETIYGIGGGGGSANIWEGTQAELEEEFDNIPNETAIIVIDDEEAIDASAEIYSEDERLIGLWTDNKPLYQRTLVIDNVTQTQNTTVDLATLSDIDHIQVIGATGLESGIVYMIPEFSDRIQFNVSTGKLQSTVPTNAGWANATLTITIQYTKTTDVPLSGVVAGKSTMYVASSDCYSTEEKEVGCAPNGKPLYQKTIIGTTLSGQTSDNKPHNISNLDEVIDAEVSCYFPTNGYWRKLNFAYNNGSVDNTWLAGFNINDTNIIFQVGNSFATGISKWYATIQYTKTTDTAGSGKFTPAGTKAEHYSTDEQVIGTWIDGKTLYRRTLTGLSIALNGTNWVNYNPSISIDKIINLHAYYVTTSDTLLSCAIAEYQYTASTGIQLTAVQGYNRTINILTIEYTKTS